MKAPSFLWSMPVAFAQTRVGPLMPRLKPSSRGVLLLVFKIENELEQVNGPWGGDYAGALRPV